MWKKVLVPALVAAVAIGFIYAPAAPSFAKAELKVGGDNVKVSAEKNPFFTSDLNQKAAGEKAAAQKDGLENSGDQAAPVKLSGKYQDKLALFALEQGGSFDSLMKLIRTNGD